MTSKPLDTSICRRIADRLVPVFSLIHEADEPREQMALYGSELFVAYREFGAENAIGAFILNTKPSEGWSGVAMIFFEFCFSPDGLGTQRLADALNKQGLKTTHQELLAFGQEVKLMMKSPRINQIYETIETLERSAA